MDTVEMENRRFETLAWGLLFVWLGAWWGFLEGALLPAGSGALGTGLILIGLNAARWFKGIPVSTLSSAFGALFAIFGGVKLTGGALNCPVERIPIFALFLIILGTIVLVREFLSVRRGDKESTPVRL